MHLAFISNRRFNFLVACSFLSFRIIDHYVNFFGYSAYRMCLPFGQPIWNSLFLRYFSISTSRESTFPSLPPLHHKDVFCDRAFNSWILKSIRPGITNFCSTQLFVPKSRSNANYFLFSFFIPLSRPCSCFRFHSLEIT